MTDYLAAAMAYRRAGWTGPLPLPPGKKWPPPEGYTGWQGIDPSGPDIQDWFDNDPVYRGTAQLGLRMPVGVIGIDVDHYGEKQGAATLEEAIRRWGPLPDAPMSSARGNGPSGIRFYQVDADVHLRTVIRFAATDTSPALGHIEIIQRHHRYAVAYPSLHPETGKPYFWYGTPEPEMPAPVSELNRLPDAWVENLRGADEPGVAEATPEEVAAFARRHSVKDGSAPLAGVIALFRKSIESGVARHDAMVYAACMAAREARDGCYPAAEAKGELRRAMVEALTESRGGQRICTEREARVEFDNVWAWAVSQAMAEDEASIAIRKERRAQLALSRASLGNVLGVAGGGGRYTGVVVDDRPHVQAPSFAPPAWTTAAVPVPESGGPKEAAEELAGPAPVPSQLVTPGPPSVALSSVPPGPPAAASTVLGTVSGGVPTARPDAPVAGAFTPPAWVTGDVPDPVVVSTAAASGADGVYERPASSWRPIDLSANWDADSEQENPTLLRREDGAFLLYPGRTHSIYGESESGKSWVALIVTAEALKAGQPVLYIDHESDPDPIKGRLKMLGVTAVMSKHLTYVRPDGPRDSAWLDLLDHTYALAVIDGVTVAISTDGGNSDSQDETARWLEQVPRMLEVRTGAAVLTVDHVTKSKDSRGRFAIGSQQKLNAVSGAAYTARVHSPFGRGQRGEMVLRLTKDRPGGIRPNCGPPGENGTQEAARIILDSSKPGPIRFEVAMWSVEGDESTDLPFGAPLADTVADWNNDAGPPLPGSVLDWTGAGKEMVRPLARYMRHAAASDPGVSRADAVGALVEIKREDGKPAFSRSSTIRAWAALVKLKVIQSGKLDDPNGRSVWVGDRNA